MLIDEMLTLTCSFGYFGILEATLDYIESEMAKRGVTQELIEETRALPETQMLKDMQNILSKGGDLEYRDPDGATPVSSASAFSFLILSPTFRGNI